MKVIVQNLAIEYRDEGSGKTLLFLHGWRNDLHSFDTLSALLSPRYRVVRLDMPGFGKSEMPRMPEIQRGVWALEDYDRFIGHFIKKLNLEVDALVGHSFGGRIIIKGMAANILHADRIVLIGSAGIAQRNTVRNLLLAIVAKIGKKLMSIPPFSFWKTQMRAQFYRSIGSDYASAGLLKKTFLKTIAEDLCESAQKITAPALLIWGADDTETPLSDGKRLSELIPNAKMEILNGTGHFVHQEKPHEVARLMEAFIC